MNTTSCKRALAFAALLIPIEWTAAKAGSIINVTPTEGSVVVPGNSDATETWSITNDTQGNLDLQITSYDSVEGFFPFPAPTSGDSNDTLSQIGVDLPGAAVIQVGAGQTMMVGQTFDSSSDNNSGESSTYANDIGISITNVTNSPPYPLIGNYLIPQVEVDSTSSAPELDPGSVATAMTLLIGSVLSVTGRRRRQALGIAPR